MQRDIIDLFHSALRSNGCVVLGTFETIESSELFRVIDKKQAIYHQRMVEQNSPPSVLISRDDH